MDQNHFQAILKSSIDEINNLQQNKNISLINCNLLLEKKYEGLNLFDVELLNQITDSLKGTTVFSDLKNILYSIKKELAQELHVNPDEIIPLKSFRDDLYVSIDKKCKKAGCNKFVNEPYDEKSCVFHADVTNKGVSGIEFNQLIFEQITEKKDFDFEKYIFPEEIKFPKQTIFKDANFHKARFLKNVYFLGVNFLEKTDFESASFYGKAFFIGSKFYEYTNFKASIFQESAIFIITQFYNDLNFDNAKFKDGVYFDATKFFGQTNFDNTRFLNNAFFDDVQFSNYTTFNKPQFSGKIVFASNTIKHSLHFNNINFAEGSSFQFQKPRLQPIDKLVVSFKNTSFVPFNTYFENIGELEDSEFSDFEKLSAFVVFRKCQLNFVSFSNNNMAIFSFHNSSFDKAKFTSNKWNMVKDSLFFIPFYRKNITIEEQLLHHKFENEEQRIKYHQLFLFRDLLNHKSLVNLYSHLKNAFIHNKNYKKAGWAYYNKFATKRLETTKYYAQTNSNKKILILFKIILLYFHKILLAFWIVLNGVGIRSKFQRTIKEMTH